MTTKIIALLVGLFAAGLSAQAAIEDVLPAQLQTADGQSVSRDTLKGKLVGVYFSASWCPPCRGFTPSLVEFRNQNKADFEVVFVSSDKTPDAQRAYMRDYKMDFLTLPHRSADASALSKRYGVSGIPTLVIIDSEGNTITKNGRADVSSNPKGAVAAWRAKASKS